MAKENVNVADELKDERQKTNLAQSAKETDKTQVIAGTDTDDEVIETTEENETQLPKIYVKRKRYTNKTDGKQYWEYVTSAMMRGSVSEVHFKASDVGGYEALEKLFGDDNKALELKVREERQYDEKTGWRKYYVYEVVFVDEIGFEWRYPLKTARTSDKAVMENYIDDSYANYARQKLISGFYGDDELALKTLRSIAGYSINSGMFNVFLKYKSLVNDNGDEITWKTENYQAQNLRSLDKKYVYNTLISLCGKSILSDFNVIRREVGYTVNGNTDSAFLQDVYTLLEANGYEYSFNEETNQGELTITYGEFAAKDFTLTVRTNDDKHSALFIRSGDIKTADGKTTITFDTSNIKTRLSNNFNWNGRRYGL